MAMALGCSASPNRARYYSDGRIIASQVPENRKQTQYIIKGGVDLRLSDDDLVTINANYDVEDHLDVAQVPFIETTTNTLTRYWFWRENEQTGHASGAINYRHDFPEAGHTLSFRAEYVRGWEDGTYRLNEVSPVRTGTDLTHIIAHENTLPVSVDYVRPMSNGRIEVGAKVQFRWIPVRYLTEPGFMSIIYPGLGDHNNWKEKIFAGYVNLVRETKALTIEAGLRAEETKVSYTLDPVNIYYQRNDAYDYFRLFPNVRLTTRLGDGSDISLFYNRRVDRPGEPELRIFPKYDDPELVKVGNPYLRPQFTTAYEVSLQQDWSRLNASLSLYHRSIKDAYQRIYAIDQSTTNYDIINKIYSNTGKASKADPFLQAAVAKAYAQIKEMETTQRVTFEDLMGYAERGEPIPMEKRALYAYNSSNVVRRLVDLIDDIMQQFGGRAIYTTSEIIQPWLDLNAGRAHVANDPNNRFGDVVGSMFGEPPAFTFL